MTFRKNKHIRKHRSVLIRSSCFPGVSITPPPREFVKFSNAKSWILLNFWVRMVAVAMVQIFYTGSKLNWPVCNRSWSLKVFKKLSNLGCLNNNYYEPGMNARFWSSNVTVAHFLLAIIRNHRFQITDLCLCSVPVTSFTFCSLSSGPQNSAAP